MLIPSLRSLGLCFLHPTICEYLPLLSKHVYLSETFSNCVGWTHKMIQPERGLVEFGQHDCKEVPVSSSVATAMTDVFQKN